MMACLPYIEIFRIKQSVLYTLAIVRQVICLVFSNLLENFNSAYGKGIFLMLFSRIPDTCSQS